MKGKLLVMIGMLMLLILQVRSDCDEERIRTTVIAAMEQHRDTIMTNTDESFQVYEEYNTNQLNGFIDNVNTAMQQGVLFGMIAWFGIVLFVLSGWSYVTMRKQRTILSHLVASIDELKQDTEPPSMSEQPVRYPREQQTTLQPKESYKDRLLKKREARLKKELARLQEKRGGTDADTGAVPGRSGDTPVHPGQDSITYGYRVDIPYADQQDNQ
jgi:hypothetical protein